MNINKSQYLNKITIGTIIIGQILMILFFIKLQKNWTWLSWLQLIGIVNGAFYAYGMFLNKAKLMGICGFIFNLITAITMFQMHLWGLVTIRVYGLFMSLYLFLKGKDNEQNLTTYKQEIIKIITILVFAGLIYIWKGVATSNLVSITLDFSAVIMLSVALYFHSKQSIKQYHWWFTSNLFNLAAAIVKQNPYLIVVFSFWQIMDTINWINWKIISSEGQK